MFRRLTAVCTARCIGKRSLSRPFSVAPRAFGSKHEDWVVLGTVGLLGVLVAPSLLRCDDPPTSTATAGEEDDPYANLPEEDEETHCSMCKTFRKGPCRPEWRKLERCFKDNEHEEGGATNCMRYFSPHQVCLSNYTNLYQLISLEMKQELVEEAELSVSEEEKRSWSPPIDWSMWVQFAKEAPGFNQTVDYESPLTPLWKRFPADTEPVLVTVSTKLPQRDEKTGLVLKIAYALDQDGMVIGLSYNDAYGDLVALSKGEEPRKQDDEVKEPTDLFDFDFVLIPGDTASVRVKALYAEDPTKAPSEKKILDACLMEGDVMSLADVQKASV